MDLKDPTYRLNLRLEFVSATPTVICALYALNGTARGWDYNPKTQALTAAQNVTKVGIGTNAPTAALEVVAAGGDDALKLLAGSIGATKVSLPFPAEIEFSYEWQPGQSARVNRSFSTAVSGFLLVQGLGNGLNAVPGSIRVDAQELGNAQSQNSNQNLTPWSFLRFVPVSAGSHTFQFTVYPPLGDGYSVGFSSGRFVLLFVRSQLSASG